MQDNIPLNQNVKQKLEELRNAEPTIRIGKNGIGHSQIEEIKLQLKAREFVKIKLLKSFLSAYEPGKQEAAIELAEKTNSQVLLVHGFVIVLYRSKFTK